MKQTKYMQIYEEMKEKMDSGALAPGDQLPDELSVCDQFGCSRMTVKKAYDLLVQEGYIYRKQGQGSFVLARTPNHGDIEINERDLSGFTKASKGKGSTRVYRFGLIFATETIARNLGINENDPVYDIYRLRLLDGEPSVIEQTYMSPALIPGITEEILNKSVYSYIENDLNMRIGAAQKTTTAEIPTEEEKEILGLKDPEPVLQVEQIAFLDNGTPFEYSISRHRYDKFRFTVYSLRK